jgi:Protein of unknown function (DUF3631)
MPAQEEGPSGRSGPQSNGVAATNLTDLDDSKLARLLNGVVKFLRRHVVLDDHQADAVALWIAHTHVLDAADITPYLSISSAEMRSGKTTLLELIEMLARDPWLTGSVSAATLARKIDQQPPPTLLLDESDTAFGGDGEYGEALRGILNSGYRRGGKYSRCVGSSGNSLAVYDFSTFGAKAIAGISKLPDTVSDRSIAIRMKRKAPGESVAKFRRREVAENAEPLQRQLAAWVEDIDVNDLAEARPEIPEELNDRAADGWEPLFAIADMAGGSWPVKARAAAVRLSIEEEGGEPSTGILLLADTRAVRAQSEHSNIFTADLIQALAGFEESPWGEWWWDAVMAKPTKGAERRLAKLLRPYEIQSQTVRVGGSTAKGYHWADFEDAWKRLLPPITENPSQATHASQPAWLGKPDVTEVTDVTGSEGAPQANGSGPHGFCPDCGRGHAYGACSGVSA